MGFMSRHKEKNEKKTIEIIAPKPPEKEKVPEKKIKPNVAPRSASASYIGKTMNIEGELITNEDITVEGIVKGSIESSKTLTIGKNGDVTANINARIVRIIGKARGSIVASDKVSILSEGRYEGTIKSEKLVVADGAILIGNVNQDEKKDTVPFLEPIQIPSLDGHSEKEKESAADDTEPATPEKENSEAAGEKAADSNEVKPDDEEKKETDAIGDTEDKNAGENNENKPGEETKDAADSGKNGDDTNENAPGNENDSSEDAHHKKHKKRKKRKK
ncbi:MAG: hypothetical protein GY757_46750 [bacterium]|nr:hypothetical protein [bacterium]